MVIGNRRTHTSESEPPVRKADITRKISFTLGNLCVSLHNRDWYRRTKHRGGSRVVTGVDLQGTPGSRTSWVPHWPRSFGQNKMYRKSRTQKTWSPISSNRTKRRFKFYKGLWTLPNFLVGIGRWKNLLPVPEKITYFCRDWGVAGRESVRSQC